MNNTFFVVSIHFGVRHFAVCRLDFCIFFPDGINVLYRTIVSSHYFLCIVDRQYNNKKKFPYEANGDVNFYFDQISVNYIY